MLHFIQYTFEMFDGFTIEEPRFGFYLLRLLVSKVQ